MPKGEIEGIDQSLRMIRRLKVQVQKRILKKAINAAGSTVAKRAKSQAARFRGLLAKSIGKKVKTTPRGEVIASIGARRGFAIMVNGKRVDPVRYAHLADNKRRLFAALEDERAKIIRQIGIDIARGLESVRP